MFVWLCEQCATLRGADAAKASEAMGRWRQALFSQMSFHSASSAEYYGLKPESVIEMGAQVVI